MGLNMKEKKSVSKEIAPARIKQGYQKVRKREKGKILDEFLKLTGYTRCYACWLLRNWGKRTSMNIKGIGRVVFVGERNSKINLTRKRPAVYDRKVILPLKKIWLSLDRPCGKRLAPFLKEIVLVLEKNEEILLDNPTRERLIRISPATVDRLLKEERKRWQIKGRSRTKPGSLLKSQIPIRTFADWNEKRPGFIEVDLVSHDGGSPRGIYIQSLIVSIRD